MMTVVMLVLAWLALCAVATLAYVFGASVGTRRGLEQATADEERSPRSGGVAASPTAVVVRLPEDANHP